MEIWVHRNGEYAGRFTESVIRGKIADGSLSENDLAWDQEKALWKPLREFLASLAAAKVEPVSSAPNAPSEAVKEVPPASSAASVEAKPAEVRRSGPPPLPSMPVAEAAPAPVRAVVPPALPVVASSIGASGPGSAIPATAPPEGEKIWNPYVAILGSIFLSPAFGG